MAKTIKFNLICDGHPVRTLDDFREHFSIEDVMAHYQSGMLQRWLEVRGYRMELEAINNVSGMYKMQAAKELVRIFGVETEESRVEEVVYFLSYEEERRKKQDYYAAQHGEIISEYSKYVAEYHELLVQMASHKDNFAALKADVGELHKKFLPIFQLDYRNLFYYLKDKAPMAVYMLLAYEEMRKKYLIDVQACEKEIYETETIDGKLLETEVDLLLKKTNTGVVLRATFIEAVKKRESKEELARKLVNFHNNPRPLGSAYGVKALDYQSAIKEVEEFFSRLFSVKQNIRCSDAIKLNDALCAMTKNQKLRDIFGNSNQFHIVMKNTEGFWDVIEESGKNYMILWMAEGCTVSSHGYGKQQYDRNSVTNRFVILDGIYFRCLKKSSEMIYMEV